MNINCWTQLLLLKLPLPCVECVLKRSEGDSPSLQNVVGESPTLLSPTLLAPTLLSHYHSPLATASLSEALRTNRFGGVLFDLQVFDDEGLTLGCVFTHVEGEHVLNRHAFAYNDWIEADVLADEVAKLVG